MDRDMTTPFDLASKVAVVTGSSRVINTAVNPAFGPLGELMN